MQQQKRQLNLARKWRSAQFETIIGQELSIRMLKNSLYLNQLFPVYLFSGQRGCGKTTTARVFACALNCQKLEDFQKDPKNTVVPCLACEYCMAMAAGQHPDFIEIDAASHTGVDNVRTIIEAASLMPVMGNKKIYLIDEAHMLSKAAFNAFLKLLEEPPDSVIFMLATTDPQKIIETVRSRCFQLFFTAIESQILIGHLQNICQKEDIKAQDQALATIVKETEGSARDAINLLEQVRFAKGMVTQEAVLTVLGQMGEHHLLTIFEYIIAQDTQQLLAYLVEIKFSTYAPLQVWEKLQDSVRSALYIKCKAISTSPFSDTVRFNALVQKVSLERLHSMLVTLYKQEELLLRTTVQHGLLEVVLLGLCGLPQEEIKKVASNELAAPVISIEKKTVIISEHSTVESPVVSKIENKPIIAYDSSYESKWQQFVKSVQEGSDPLLLSLFTQARYRSFDEKTGALTVVFSQDISFFNEWLSDAKAAWNKRLQELFGKNVQLNPVCESEKKTDVTAIKKTVSPLGQSQQPIKKVATPQAMPNKIMSQSTQQRVKRIDVSNKEEWKVANQLLDEFGGTVVEELPDEKVS